jgi:hypothetical protein
MRFDIRVEIIRLNTKTFAAIWVGKGNRSSWLRGAMAKLDETMLVSAL